MSNRYPRTRVSSNASLKPAKYYWAGDGFSHLYVNGSPWEWTFFSSASSFEDVTGGRNKQSGKYPISPCSHSKYEYYHYKEYQPFVGDHGFLHIPVDTYPFLQVSDIDSLLPQDFSGSLFSQLNEEAFISFSTQFPQKLSFAEFLVGLKDLRDLLPKFEESVGQAISGAYLQKKFGWDNLLSDLRALGSLMSSVQSRLDFLRKSYGKPTRIGFYKADVLHPTLGTYIEHVPVRGWGTRIKFVGYRCDVRYSATLLQKLEHLNDTYGLFRGFVGALGLDNPLKAVWENLPFSFVVDWFARVSTHLDRLAKVHPGEQWDVYDITRSRDESALFEVVQFNDNISPNPGNPEIKLGVVKFDRYVRALGLPIGYDVYSLSNLTPEQLTLFLAMLFANTR